jgi:putative aldouronate transport system substrate-binding protein
MKRKAIVAWCTLLVLTAGSFAGCTKPTTAPTATAGNSKEVSPKNPITISVFIGDSTIPTATADNKMYKKIKDELGITFNIETLAGDINQKLGVMIAGGQLPDIVTYNSKFQDAGQLIALEDKVKANAPDVYTHYAPYWGQMKDQNDQHIYALPNWGAYHGKYTATYYGGPAFWIQKDVLKEAGYPKVTTLDQYFSLISDYQKKHPQVDGQPTIGFETLATPGQSFILENAPSQLAGSPNDGGVIVKNGVADTYADKDASKNYFKKLNEAYNAGLVDKEAITQNQDQFHQKIATGRVLGFYNQHWEFGSAEATLTKNEKFGQTYAPLALTYDGVKAYYRDRPVINLGNGFAITKNAKDPDRILAALNILMSDKWQKLLNWGVEGQDYSIDPATKQPVWDAQQQKNFNDNAYKAANTAQAIYSFMPKIEGQYSDGNATSIGDNSVQYEKGLNDYDRAFLKAYKVKSLADMMGEAPENPIHYPAWNINIPANSPASIAGTELNNTQLKWLPRVISTKPADFDAQWDAYMAEYKKSNVKAYLDAVNAGIQYRTKNWAAAAK